MCGYLKNGGETPGEALSESLSSQLSIRSLTGENDHPVTSFMTSSETLTKSTREKKNNKSEATSSKSKDEAIHMKKKKKKKKKKNRKKGEGEEENGEEEEGGDNDDDDDDDDDDDSIKSVESADDENSEPVSVISIPNQTLGSKQSQKGYSALDTLQTGTGSHLLANVLSSTPITADTSNATHLGTLSGPQSSKSGKVSHETLLEEEYNRKVDSIRSEFIYLLQLSHYSGFYGPQPKYIWRNDGTLMHLSTLHSSSSHVTQPTLLASFPKDISYKELEGWIARQVFSFFCKKKKKNWFFKKSPFFFFFN
ncbi:hypothetical protein RFI_08137 [Reticulomyxa filosa]|uniref:Uncharacterized protein n=1 Tax=Reticulomyxa filosa TaxID=46433 RepID=X6NSS8_RETFI|nr:hypothetical protein RFI_08137 [Reticulomyxa filosa]|eukprot:ETO28988.1 hypothetical protein RFI_08137 [Reticulomyxa filosa]